VAVVRDLALVPPGTYRMVQAWEMTGTQTNQFGNGAKTEKTKLASSNRFSFAVEVLSFIKLDLEKRRSPDEDIKQVLAIGPLACTAVLGRYREANIRELKAILHQLLVDLRGQDLGANPDAWQDWCNTVVREPPSKP
jgi:hypothetical protein